ncbi:OB-fold nucleic acid binding domain-containing protein, partial [Planctomycetota bacterium]
MNKTTIDSLKNFENAQVTLSGWLYKSRSSGKVQFLILRDGTGLCQCIVEKGKVTDDIFEQLKHLGQESSLSLTGVVRADDRSLGGCELAVTAA